LEDSKLAHVRGKTEVPRRVYLLRLVARKVSR